MVRAGRLTVRDLANATQVLSNATALIVDCDTAGENSNSWNCTSSGSVHNSTAHITNMLQTSSLDLARKINLNRDTLHDAFSNLSVRSGSNAKWDGDFWNGRVFVRRRRNAMIRAIGNGGC